MIAGQLEVQMFANLARLTADMASAKGTVDRTMKGIEGAVASAKSVLAGLGIGLSVGYFANLIKGSIDAMDHLHDLNLTTKISIETLSGLKLAAKQSGGDIDSIAASLNKLSVEMGKAPAKFRALGITAKDPLEAFKQLSDIFVAIDDQQLRAALGAETLGKAWAGAAPLLAEGSVKIGEMVSAGTKAAGVSTDMARKADELNDKWVLLVGSGGLLNSIVGLMLDPLIRLTDQMNAAKNAADGWLGAMARFVTVGGDTAKNPASAIAEIDRKLIALAKTSKEFAAMGTVKRLFSADDIALVNAQIAALKIQRETLVSLMEVQSKPMLGMAGNSASAKTADATAKAKEFVEAEARAAAAKAAAAKALADDKEFAREKLAWNTDVDRAQQVALDSRMSQLDAIDAAEKKSAADQIELDREVMEWNAMVDREQKKSMDASLRDIDEQMLAQKKIFDNFVENVQRTMGDQLYQVMQGNFKNIGTAFAQMLERMLADAMAANLMQAMFSGAAAGSGMGIFLKIFGASSGSPNIAAGAKGAWFDGNTANFARGGIVNSPTRFSFGGGFANGMMGEAGPEAIMPLKRDSAGRLGVSGGGMTIAPVYNIHIDSRTDRAEVSRLVTTSVQRGNADLVEQLARSGRI